jgi:type IV pilus assembly protein PilQ
MKTIERLLTLSLLPASMLAMGNAHALQLTGLDTSVATGASSIRLHFDSAAKTPKSFMLQNPPRIVLDISSATLAKSVRKGYQGKGLIQHIDVVQASNRTRLTVRLKKSAQYVTERKGNDIIVRVINGNKQTQSSSKRDWVNKVINIPELPAKKSVQKTTRPAYKKAPRVANRTNNAKKVLAQGYTSILASHKQRPASNAKTSYARSQRMLGNVDFRRDAAGNGKVIIDLPDTKVDIKNKKAGNSVMVTLKGVDLPQNYDKLDVTDFATPVTSINLSRSGADARIQIVVRGDFAYHVARKGKQLQVSVNKVDKNVRLKDLRNKKKTYKGDKLTLNFQDIEVRSVLQLLADFTDKNIVVSDTVQGSITLRLKDVPWDQAMDIVLRSKGLGMRENGNVIWVAPAAELSARENRELEELNHKKKLEPLVTEYMSVNFAKATELSSLIKSSTGKDSSSLLSERGNVSVDARTNTLLIQDTVSRVEEIRELVKALDVPVRQVAIESRIVIANDEFSKSIGTRFGVTSLASINGGKGLIAGSGSSRGTDGIINDAVDNLQNGGNVFPVGIPKLDDRLNVNLPASGSMGSFAFSVLSKNLLLDLELSALQAESKGEIISTPRVVTANQSAASIQQGVQIPYLQASSSGAANVAFKSAVLRLDVTPQITPDDHVIMDLKVNQDTVGRVFAGVPSINTRSVQTKVLVDNGQTVVLGGVHEETNTNDVDKVPLLGDLPVIGNIFKRTTSNKDRRELLIFVTPKILN